MAETQRDKRIRALALYATLERALFALDQLLDNQCEGYGLSRSQYRVLEHVFLYGAMATGRLAGRVLFGESTISVVTKNLAKLGLLVRRGDDSRWPQGNRSFDRSGERSCGRDSAEAREAAGRKMCVLGKHEQENLARLCEKLAARRRREIHDEITLDDGDVGEG